MRTKSILATLLIGATLVACAPAVVVPPAPNLDLSATPVARSANGMVVAHAGLTGWGPAAAALPPGARAIVLEGDPTKAELFTLRLSFPHNYTVPPHFHPTWEHVTIISGLLHIGMGDRIDMASATELLPGSFMALPSGMRHFAHAVGETVVQIHGMGPFTVTYVNPADDPRRR